MATRFAAPRNNLFLCALVLLALARPGGVHAASYQTLYAFGGQPDGGNPWSSLVRDKAGNLYGTTVVGGTAGVCSQPRLVGCGTVFRLAPDGSETILHAFTGRPDGAYPRAGLVADGSGNLYGTTEDGGTYDKGTVFKLAADGSESILYSFNGRHGVNPEAVLVMDGSGNLYGTTDFGGDRNCPQRIYPSGCGVVFKLAPDGSETVLHAFADGGEGNEPQGGLVMDASGNLYGMTDLGGSGFGNVFEIAPDGTESVLYSFQGMPDGARPSGELIRDSAGNLYGTTGFGGNACQHSIFGCGVVFRLKPDGKETVLYAFSENGSDGIVPGAGLVADDTGNLYGTTYFGGSFNFGTVFELANSGAEMVLHAFGSQRDYLPVASLLVVKDHLFGTVSAGERCGKNGNRQCGSVFELQK